MHEHNNPNYITDPEPIPVYDVNLTGESLIGVNLRVWRDKYQMPWYHQRCASVSPSYSVAVLSAGGCLDTMAAIRTGFTPIWGTEIDTDKQLMWRQLTCSPCLGDTFQLDYASLTVPTYLKSGQDCTDYTRLHGNTGAEVDAAGKTGNMYVDQCDLIETVQPKSICLEMVANALEVNGGTEVQVILHRLSKLYHIHHAIVQMWRYGDPSNRQRFIIVGFHKHKVGDIGKEFVFPRYEFDEDNAPIARDTAVPDVDVPDEYRRDNNPYRTRGLPVTPGTLDKIGELAPGCGYSTNPHTVYSWDGLWNTQLTTNGGGVRPRLDWDRTTEIGETRLTVPIETVRIASLPSSYLTWARSVNPDDKFLTSCVNMGVPLRTSTRIDDAVHAILVRAGIEFDVERHTDRDIIDSILNDKDSDDVHMDEESADFAGGRSWVGAMRRIRCMLLDTGATDTFIDNI